MKLSALVDGAWKCLENAKSLYAGAVSLSRQRLFGVAVFLHQTSLEECAKIDLIGEEATSSLLSRGAIDVAKLQKVLRDHRRKNAVNANDLRPTDGERRARQIADWEAANIDFEKEKDAFCKEAMRLRNASLFVDLQDGAFTAPSEVVFEVTVDRIRRFNDDDLSAARSKVNLLEQWPPKPILAAVEARKARDPFEVVRENSKIFGSFDSPKAEMNRRLDQRRRLFLADKNPG